MATPVDAVRIRLATEADREFAVGLVPRLRAFGPTNLRSPEALDAAEQRALTVAFDDLPRGHIILVADHRGGTLLGIAYATPATDYFTGETHGHLSILAVAENGEGRGVGARLVTAVEGWAAKQGYRFVTLNVFAGNGRARSLYERAGYEADTIRYVKEL